MYYMYVYKYIYIYIYVYIHMCMYHVTYHIIYTRLFRALRLCGSPSSGPMTLVLLSGRELCEPGLRYPSAQCLWKFCGELRRSVQAASVACKMINMYCGRRSRTTTAQNNINILAHEIH